MMLLLYNDKSLSTLTTLPHIDLDSSLGCHRPCRAATEQSASLTSAQDHVKPETLEQGKGRCLTFTKTKGAESKSWR